MESGKTLDTQTETEQPTESLAADVEDKTATPIADNTDEVEIYVEEEGDQEKPKHGMTQAQSYAAFQKEKEKRKRKNEQLEDERAKREQLEREVAELKSTVGKITKGAPPKIADFDYDEDEYQKAVKQYYTNDQAQTEDKPKPQTDDNLKKLRDEAEFYLYSSEQELASKLPDYEKVKETFNQALTEQLNCPDTDDATAYLATIAQQSGVDIGKAIFAIGKFPELVAELKKAGNNQFAISKTLERAANRVKTRSKNPIDTQPEPEISTTGGIDANASKIAKLREKWQKDSNKENYNAYQAAKNKKVN
jgi:hypothetical protein